MMLNEKWCKLEEGWIGGWGACYEETRMEKAKMKMLKVTSA